MNNWLGLVIHWIAFICLLVTVLIAILIYVEIEYVDKFFRTLRQLWRLISFHSSSYLPESIIHWVAISHWPIKFITTGNKNLFPWSKVDNSRKN